MRFPVHGRFVFERASLALIVGSQIDEFFTGIKENADEIEKMLLDDALEVANEEMGKRTAAILREEVKRTEQNRTGHMLCLRLSRISCVPFEKTGTPHGSQPHMLVL